MSRRAAFILLALAGALFAADHTPSAPQPVMVVLYSRFFDHSHAKTNYERVQRLLALLDKLNTSHPNSGISALFQFSGTTSQLLEDENAQLALVDKIKDSARRGLVEIGYTGEDEPSYLHRPTADLLLADSGEARWKAKSDAARRFLTDFKDPVTGDPIPGLSGGLKRTQEIFGEAAFLSGANPSRTAQGGDTFVAHQIRRMNQNAVLTGIPVNDSRRGIEGSAVSAMVFSKIMSPEPLTSPEVFWADGFLRLSDVSLADNKPHSTDEGVEELKKAFGKLDRSHVRVVKLEIGSFARYLTKRADGTVLIDPMEWLYYHPDDPRMPPTMKPMVQQNVVEEGYRKEEAVLKWLLEEFLPGTPGSRIVSIHELARRAADPDGPNVNREQLRAMATTLQTHFSVASNQPPNYARAGSRFFSAAEAFELLAQALAGLDKTGSLPDSVKLSQVYGPIFIPFGGAANKGTVTVADVIHSAAQLDATLRNTTWKPVPDNALPALVHVGSLDLNSAQLLRLMALAYLDPVPQKALSLGGIPMHSRATFMFPKNAEMVDLGVGWTYKPALWHLEAAPPAPPAAK